MLNKYYISNILPIGRSLNNHQFFITKIASKINLNNILILAAYSLFLLLFLLLLLLIFYLFYYLSV